MTELPGHVVTHMILPVADMAAAAGFYRRLGFEVELFDPGYAWVRHAGHEIFHLAHEPTLDPATNIVTGYLHVQDADAWHDLLSTRAEIGEIADRPWDMREFSLTDPSGNRLRVGHNL